jgi:hypothetical protein
MVKLSIDTKNLTVNLIDDSESTPGISRQITFFKSYLLRIMQMQMNKINKDDSAEEKSKKIDEIIKIPNNFFKPVKNEVSNGVIFVEYEYDVAADIGQ